MEVTCVLRMQRGATGERQPGEPREVASRMDARAVVGEHPSVEAAAGRLALERGLLQHHRRLAEQVPSLGLVLAQSLHSRFAMREVEPSGLRVHSVGRARCRGRATNS